MRRRHKNAMISILSATLFMIGYPDGKCRKPKMNEWTVCIGYPDGKCTKPKMSEWILCGSKEWIPFSLAVSRYCEKNIVDPEEKRLCPIVGTAFATCRAPIGATSFYEVAPMQKSITILECGLRERAYEPAYRYLTRGGGEEKNNYSITFHCTRTGWKVAGIGTYPQMEDKWTDE